MPSRKRPRQPIKSALKLAPILLLTLTSCETPMATVGTDAFCSIAKPITWSVHDTDETIREVKEHNAVYTKLCVK